MIRVIPENEIPRALHVDIYLLCLWWLSVVIFCFMWRWGCVYESIIQRFVYSCRWTHMRRSCIVLQSERTVILQVSENLLRGMHSDDSKRPEALDKGCFVLAGIDGNFCCRRWSGSADEWWMEMRPAFDYTDKNRRRKFWNSSTRIGALPINIVGWRDWIYINTWCKFSNIYKPLQANELR